MTDDRIYNVVHSDLYKGSVFYMLHSLDIMKRHSMKEYTFDRICVSPTQPEPQPGRRRIKPPKLERTLHYKEIDQGKHIIEVLELYIQHGQLIRVNMDTGYLEKKGCMSVIRWLKEHADHISTCPSRSRAVEQ